MMLNLLNGIIVTVLSTGAIALLTMVISHLINKKRRLARENLDRILEWYRYIDTNLESDDYNWAKVESMEKEISHHFKSTCLKGFVLNFNKKIISLFLKRMGIKKSLRNNLNLFLQYSKLDRPDMKVLLALQSKVDQKRYTCTKLPFSFYWDIIRTNYFKFHLQYKSNGKNLKTGEREYKISDIEVPIKLLRIIFKR